MVMRIAENAAVGLGAGAVVGALFPLSVLGSRDQRALEAALVGAVAGAMFAIGAGAENIEVIWTAAVAATGASLYLLVLNFSASIKRLSAAPPDEGVRPDD